MNRLLGPRTIGWRRWLLVGVALIGVAIVGALWITRPGPSDTPVGKLYVVEDTTLLALQGDVRHQPLGAANFAPVAGEQRLQPGDRVRTGADGYAWILYLDGSSTSVGPDAEVALLGIEQNPTTGLAAIVVEQPRGRAWTLAAGKSTGAPALVLTSVAGRASARTGQFTTEVTPDGTVVVTAVEGIVEGRTAAGAVDLPAGFTTRLRPGQPPDVPVPSPPPPVAVEVRIQGPVSALLTDARGRSVGYHPTAEPYVSQIPGARLRRGDRGAQVFTVPSPVEGYTLTLRGQGAGPAVVTVGGVRGDEPAAAVAARLEATVGDGQLLATEFAWRDGAVTDARALAPAPGPPPTSAVAQLARPPPSFALAPAGAPSPLATPEPEGPGASHLATMPAAEQTGAEQAPDGTAESAAGDAAATDPVGALAPLPVSAPAAPPVSPATLTPPASGLAPGPPSAVAAPAAPTDVPLTVGVVLVPATASPTPAPPTPEPPSPPATPPPPTEVPTVPAPLATPTPTPTHSAPAARTTVPNARPAIAPTATPYRPPLTPVAPRTATPTRCLYPSC